MTFQFDSLDAFLYMNGHGVYVWFCYAVVFTVLVVLALNPVLGKKAFLKQQKKLIQLQNNNDN